FRVCSVTDGQQSSDNMRLTQRAKYRGQPADDSKHCLTREKVEHGWIDGIQFTDDTEVTSNISESNNWNENERNEHDDTLHNVGCTDSQKATEQCIKNDDAK